VDSDSLSANTTTCACDIAAAGFEGDADVCLSFCLLLRCWDFFGGVVGFICWDGDFLSNANRLWWSSSNQAHWLGLFTSSLLLVRQYTPFRTASAVTLSKTKLVAFSGFSTSVKLHRQRWRKVCSAWYCFFCFWASECYTSCIMKAVIAPTSHHLSNSQNMTWSFI